MEKFISHKDNSRTNWGASVEGGTNPDKDAIQLGCMLRIADATEAMAKEYTRLIRERDNFKRGYEDRGQAVARLERSNAALRGVVTKLKKAKLQSGINSDLQQAK